MVSSWNVVILKAQSLTALSLTSTKLISHEVWHNVWHYSCAVGTVAGSRTKCWTYCQTLRLSKYKTDFQSHFGWNLGLLAIVTSGAVKLKVVELGATGKLVFVFYLFPAVSSTDFDLEWLLTRSFLNICSNWPHIGLLFAPKAAFMAPKNNSRWS